MSEELTEEALAWIDNELSIIKPTIQFYENQGINSDECVRGKDYKMLMIIRNLIENYEFIKNERDYLKGIVVKYQEIVGKVVIKPEEAGSE